MPIEIKDQDNPKKRFLDYRDYAEDVKNRMTGIIMRQETSGEKNEAELQAFFEKYPSALLGVLSSVPANYQIGGMSVISQPRIKSYSRDRQPDFLIMTTNSQELYFNFIEIESPAKKLFHPKNFDVSDEFKHALSQLRQWKSFNKDVIPAYCKELIEKVFKDNADLTKEKNWHYNFILLYGNSNEITDKKDSTYNNLITSHFTEHDFHHITFSRLMDAYTFKFPLMTILRKATDNQFRAIGMVPLKTYGLDEWINFHLVTGKEEVVKNLDILTDAEKTELIKQIIALDTLNAKAIWKRNDLTTWEFGSGIDFDVDNLL